MKARTPKATLLLALLAISTSTSASEAVVSHEGLREGDTVVGPLKIGRRIISLPAGNWQRVTRGERPTSVDGLDKLGSMVNLSFQELIGKRVHRTLEISATPQSSRVNWLDEPCKTKGDSYWIDDRSSGINSQFCIRVGFTAGFVDEARGEIFQRWANDIKKNGIGYSREMPFVLVTKYIRSDFLRMRLQFDPSVSGISNSRLPARTLNDWNPTSPNIGSKQITFYEALKDWAPQFGAAAARAFDGDASLRGVDFGAPSLPKP